MGAVDSEFGLARVNVASVLRNQEVRAISLQPDGKLVVAGFTNNRLEDEVLIARYLANMRVYPFGSPARQGTAR
jgi:hypothetical protein